MYLTLKIKLILVLFSSIVLFYHFSSIQEKTIHVFIEEIGTAPAFGGLSIYATLPKKSPKVIAYHRVFPLKKVDFKKHNTIWIDVPRDEENYHQKVKFISKEIKHILNNSNADYVIFYTGVREYDFVKNLYDTLQNKNIKLKHIHLWEDGFFNILMGTDTTLIKNQIQKNNQNCSIRTTYHIASHKNIKNKNIDKITQINNCLNVDFKEFNIYQLREKLSFEQKKLFFDIIGFDYKKFEWLKQKNFILFLTGHVHLDPSRKWKQTPLSMLSILKATKTEFSQKQKDAIWGFKLHPSLGIYDMSLDIKKSNPDMIEIPAYVPFETLIVAGIYPNKIVSSGSSFLFWLNNNQVLKYISHPYYDIPLKEQKIVQDKNMIYPHLPSTDEKDIQYPNIDGGVFPEYIPNRFCKKNALYECFSVIKINDFQMNIKWDNGASEIYFLPK